MEGKESGEGRTAYAGAPRRNEDGVFQKSHAGQNSKRAERVKGSRAVEQVMGSRNYSP